MAEDDRLLHALPEATHERIFRNRIVPRLLPQSAGAAEPVAIILGGQPGAGKTALLTQATETLRASGPTVVINGDELRPYHPAYSGLQRTDPLNAARYTDHDSGKWVEKLIAEAQERRVNLVIESTMRRPEVFSATSATLHSSGYQVEAHVLAVSERLSWQGVHQRYEQMMAEGRAARFSARDAHDAGASGMLDTLSRIEGERSAERVMIATRDGRTLYDNRLVAGEWQRPPEASDIVRAERERARTPAELATIERSWGDVVSSMQARQAPPAELQRVMDQARDDGRHFREGMARVQATAGQPAPLREAPAMGPVVQGGGADQAKPAQAAAEPPMQRITVDDAIGRVAALREPALGEVQDRTRQIQALVQAGKGNNATSRELGGLLQESTALRSADTSSVVTTLQQIKAAGGQDIAVPASPASSARVQLRDITDGAARSLGAMQGVSFQAGAAASVSREATLPAASQAAGKVKVEVSEAASKPSPAATEQAGQVAYWKGVAAKSGSGPKQDAPPAATKSRGLGPKGG